MFLYNKGKDVPIYIQKCSRYTSIYRFETFRAMIVSGPCVSLVL